MKSGIDCNNCGKSMTIEQLRVYADHKQGDRFVDIIYKCEECGTARVCRYKDEYFFCNFKNYYDLRDYKPCDENRDLIYSFRDSEPDEDE